MFVLLVLFSVDNVQYRLVNEVKMDVALMHWQSSLPVVAEFEEEAEFVDMACAILGLVFAR